MRRLLLVLLAGLGANACQPEEYTPLSLAAVLALDREAVDFGNVAVGSAAHDQIRLRNRGAIPVSLSVSLDGADRDRFHLSSVTLQLAAGQLGRLSLTFAPDRAAELEATVVLQDFDDPSLEVQVSLRGTGFIPDCDDRNPCTTDAYDVEVGACQHLAQEGRCDDARRCTVGDRCHRGICAGAPVTCDDGVGCTIDSCDEVRGCVAHVDHRRCGVADPCLAGLCDPQQGCVVEAVPDGSRCGELSCREMSICVQGQCRRGPTPEGVPCDDGDPCTAGDRCAGGICQAGTSRSLAVSDPVIIDPAGEGLADLAYSFPGAVLAVNLPAAGGLDVVWTVNPGWASVDVQVYRDLVDVDGSLLARTFLGTGQYIEAAFLGDDLVLLLAGCQTCRYDGGAPFPGGAPEDQRPDPAPCDAELRHYTGFQTVESRCLVESLALNSWALATSTEHVFVASEREDPGGETHSVVVDQYTPELRHLYRFPFYTFDVPPEYSNYWSEVSGLQLDATGGLVALGFVLELVVDDEPTCSSRVFECGSSSRDSSMMCISGEFLAALDPATGALDSLITEAPTRGVRLAPLTGLYGLNRTLRGVVDEENQICVLLEQVNTFVPDSRATFASRQLAEQRESTLGAVTPAALFDFPAALMHSSDGSLRVVGRVDGEVVQLSVPAPTSISDVLERIFIPSSSAWGGNLPSATTSVADGFVVVAIAEVVRFGETHGQGIPDEEGAVDGEGTALIVPPQPPSYRLVYFTVGCGVEVSPRP